MSKTLLTVFGAATALACVAEVLVQPQDPGRRLTGRNSPLQVVEPNAADLNLRTTPVVAAVERAADSVVSIYIVNREGRGRRRQEATEGQGSGVILDEAGLVITNWHVVATALAGGPTYRVEVRLKDGRSYPSTIMSSSPDDDLALLQLQLDRGDKVKPVLIGDSGSLMVGETVIAIGNPQGHANTVTTGVLSAVGRSIVVRTPTGVRRYRNLLQTDAAINQGNSGGALLDITGKLVGINNAMAQGSENIGFAIPVDTMREVFENDLLSSENLTSSVWLGTSVQNQGDAIVVTDVDPQGPAGRAGMQVGDRLVRAGQSEVRNMLDYTRKLLNARIGEPLPVVVQRSGREVNLRLVPESYSNRRALAANRDIRSLAGMTLEEITWEQNEALVRAATLGFYEDDPRPRVPRLPVALRIREVERGGPADDLGLEAGDILLSVVRNRYVSRGVRLESALEAARELMDYRGREAWIWIMRDGDVQEGPLPVRG